MVKTTESRKMSLIRFYAWFKRLKELSLETGQPLLIVLKIFEDSIKKLCVLRKM